VFDLLIVRFLFSGNDGVLARILNCFWPSTTAGDTSYSTLKRKFDEFQADSMVVLPERYLDNTLKSTITILKDSESIGVGFFLRSDVVVTCLHNLYAFDSVAVEASTNKIKKSLIISNKFKAKSHSSQEIQLSLVQFSVKYDVAFLKSDVVSNNILEIYSCEKVPRNCARLAVTTFQISSTQAVADSSIQEEGFTVVPANLLRTSNHHIVYGSQLFSGDSGGGVVFAPEGKVIAIHVETFNEASERLSLAASNTEVVKSINNLLSGLSQGFIGLRLDSLEITELFKNVN
jgi:hypothetical protein